VCAEDERGFSLNYGEYVMWHSIDILERTSQSQSFTLLTNFIIPYYYTLMKIILMMMMMMMMMILEKKD
jgi:hypothetical protein